MYAYFSFTLYKLSLISFHVTISKNQPADQIYLLSVTMMLLALINYLLPVFKSVSMTENGNHFVSNGRGGDNLIQKIDYKILEGLEVQIRKSKRTSKDV